MATPRLVDLDVIRGAETVHQPYTYLVASNVLKQDAIDTLRKDFPDISKPGFLTVDDIELRSSFKQLVDELESDEFASVLSEKLGLDLTPYPRLTTVRKISQLKDGRIHTDSESKLATFLVYMNDQWTPSGPGCLRVLRGPNDFEDMAAEILPLMGSAFGFVRSDTSWHGHMPFAGERRVVQITWLRDTKALEHKKKRNSFAKFFKRIFGR